MLASTIPHDDRPLTDGERLSRFVDDLITLNAEGAATRGRLYELGWPPAFIDANLEKAQALANKRFVRDVREARAKSFGEIERDIADIVASHLPATQFLIADCQARGISKRHLELLFDRARARAALAFCTGQTGWAP